MNRSIILKAVMSLLVVLSPALAWYGTTNTSSASAPGRNHVLAKGAAGPVGRAAGQLVCTKSFAKKSSPGGPVGSM